jgi:hypothetical protein
VKRFRNNEAPRLGGLEIDNQLDLRGLLDWHAMPSAWLLRNVRRYEMVSAKWRHDPTEFRANTVLGSDPNVIKILVRAIVAARIIGRIEWRKKAEKVFTELSMSWGSARRHGRTLVAAR